MELIDIKNKLHELLLELNVPATERNSIVETVSVLIEEYGKSMKEEGRDDKSCEQYIILQDIVTQLEIDEPTKKFLESDGDTQKGYHYRTLEQIYENGIYKLQE